MSNRLAHEASPYLRQHADNPVDWHPWGDEAFARARAEDKPILLSVGYSACHWCHVMAHESFENTATAAVMNEHFVNVKVDREERPDVDAVYMEATQAMSGQGGWPMTVFTTPDGRPFFAGTYFPPEAQAGRPGFAELLEAVADTWRTRRAEVDEQATGLRDAIAARTQNPPSALDPYEHGAHWLHHALDALLDAHDHEWGGFGRAPKFPQGMAIEWLLDQGDNATQVAVTTLDAMASGGIYDHLGGGFARYSVDAFWMVPHFEKMLYDQATLLSTYTSAAQRTGHDRYRQVATEIVEYVLRTLVSPDGAFFSAEDADSEGEEGRFYVWRPEEIDAVLGDSALADDVKRWYGVTASGNFEGSNILHRPERGALLRPAHIEDARQRLLTSRDERVRPGLDDKVLTEWNAMFIAALARAATALDRPDWLAVAAGAADFLISRLRVDGRWFRSWHESSGPRHLAYANDYAWLVDAFTRLAEATGEARWRREAEATADAMQALFWDDEHGGYFTSGNDGEQLIVHTKDLYDGATASANSEAAVASVRLSALTGNAEYRLRAERIVGLVAEPLGHHPTAFTNMLRALQLLVDGTTQTVVVGLAPHDLIRAVHREHLPGNVLLWGEEDESELWRGKGVEGAYVCQHETCTLPITSAAVLREHLTAARRKH